jgi:hypothetical protein
VRTSFVFDFGFAPSALPVNEHTFFISTMITMVFKDADQALH